MSTQNPEINIDLHKKQTIAFNSKATEIFYGGAAGGGKSHLMRVVAIIWAAAIPGLQVYIFRRVHKDLIKNHIEGPKGFRNLLGPWERAGFCTIVGEDIRFWNGSKIYLCHCQHEKDRYNYLGAEIHVLLIDELTTFTEKIYRFLRGRVRSVGLPELPEQYKGCFPRILASSNPGNIGHNFVKESFITGVEPFAIRQMPDEDGGMLRQFIPALIEDNPSMEQDDPGYRARLKGLGSKALAEAMELGNWDIIEGAYFDCWSKHHVIEPFAIPRHWLRFRSFDWGSAKPFSCGWYAVSDGYDNKGKWIPVGALIKYKEYYGCKKDASGKTIPDVGLKMTVEQIADEIKRRDGDDKITYSVADPAIFTQDGGPSFSERFAGKGIYFRKADNKRIPEHGRVGGWDSMRSRLRGEDDKPMLYFFRTCIDSIRTIPTLLHDESRPEDLNTNMEDHAADECRYACMSRPWVAADPNKTEARKDRWDIDDDEDEGWKTA